MSEPDLSPLHGRTIAVDLDGVVHSYTSGWTGGTIADPPEPGAAEFLRALLDAGAKPVIFTTRADTDAGVGLVRRWLADNGLPVLPATAVKPAYAVAFVDDRAVPYRPGSGAWTAVLARLVQLVADGPAAPYVVDMRDSLAGASVTGRTVWARSSRPPTCICCDGPHVYARRVELDSGKHPWDWLQDTVGQLPEGAAVRITIELADDPH